MKLIRLLLTLSIAAFFISCSDSPQNSMNVSGPEHAISMAPANGTSVHGLKWEDENGNGQRDEGEPGLPGVVIYSDLNNNGIFDENEPRTTTMEDNNQTEVDESGHYWLDDAGGPNGAEAFCIRELVPDGFVQTYPVENGGAHKLFLPTSPKIDAAPLTFEGVDFGNMRERGAEVHGVKWWDANANGRREDDEPGLPGVIIFCDINGNGRYDDNEPATRTMQDDPDTEFDESGHYWLQNLRPGYKCIREVLHVGWQQTFPLNSYHCFELEEGEIVDGVDFGNARRPEGQIHGIKWLDENGNGQRDPGEPGIPGVVIYCDSNNNGRFDDNEPRTRTMERGRGDEDMTGHYWLDGLPTLSDEHSGICILREILPDGFCQTFPADGYHRVRLLGGQRVEGVDFGNWRCPDGLGSIHGTKWEDENGDGQRGADEPGLPGVTIYIDFNNNGELDDDEPRTTTMVDNPVTDFDEAGHYWLEDVQSGLYVVREVVPDGFIQSFPITPHLVDVEDGETVEGIDFGNVRRVINAGTPVELRKKQ